MWAYNSLHSLRVVREKFRREGFKAYIMKLFINTGPFSEYISAKETSHTVNRESPEGSSCGC